MRVFLIHGMGRTPLSMAWLAARLYVAGHRPSLFGYTVTFEDLDAIAARFTERVHKTLAADRRASADTGDTEAPYAVVGHSLGNLVTRLASPRLPSGFCRFVMLAPPNHSPAIARALRDHPLFVALTRDTGRRLCEEDFYAALPVPAVPSLVIAGTRGIAARWHPLADRANDAVIAVDETRLDDAPLATVPGVHSFLMNRSDVFALAKRFLADGQPPAGAQTLAPFTVAPRPAPDEPPGTSP